MEPPTSAVEQEDSCPRCRSALRDELERCNTCGLTLTDVRLYRPKHFVWFALLFSGLTPIYMAATNLGRLGRKREKWLWLGLGFTGFVLLFGVFASLPEMETAGRFVGYLINLPIGWFAREQQKRPYRIGLRLGAKQASTFVGVLLGLGVTLLALAIPVVSLTAHYEIQFQRGLRALQEDRCEEAQEVFARLYRLDSEDFSAIYNLGCAEYCLGEWEAAIERFRAYVNHVADDPDGHALLGDCLAQAGRVRDAERSLQRALQLDPGVLERLFDSDPTIGMPGNAVHGTPHVQRCMTQLRAILDDPARLESTGWGLTLGPGLLQTMERDPEQNGEPLWLEASINGEWSMHVGQFVEPGRLEATLGSPRLRDIIGQVVDGQARPAERQEREYASLAQWRILGEPVTLVEKDGNVLLMQIEDGEKVIWIDLISAYPIESEALLLE